MDRTVIRLWWRTQAQTTAGEQGDRGNKKVSSGEEHKLTQKEQVHISKSKGEEPTIRHGTQMV